MYPAIKRVLDFFSALILLLIASPVLIILGIVLFFTGHRPVFFIQPRVGYREKIFRLIKFRTMTDARDAEGKLLPDASRMTKLGSFIRRTSLDELPQLLNVLRGDMSIVGPRPLLVEYLPLYNEEQKKRHQVSPGITGWAQVNGRNAIGWDDKFKLDVMYVQKRSFFLDLKILLLTVRKLLRAEGISMQGHATVAPFKGNK